MVEDHNAQFTVRVCVRNGLKVVKIFITNKVSLDINDPSKDWGTNLSILPFWELPLTQWELQAWRAHMMGLWVWTGGLSPVISVFLKDFTWVAIFWQHINTLLLFPLITKTRGLLTYGKVNRQALNKNQCLICIECYELKSNMGFKDRINVWWKNTALLLIRLLGVCVSKRNLIIHWT